MKIRFNNEEIQIDDSWTNFFHEQSVELKKIENLIGNNFTPNTQDIFKIFRLPVSNIKFVVVGQDPYPQPGVATGRSFEIEQDTWTNVNASLKTILSSVYFYENAAFLEYDSIIEKLDQGLWNISPPNSFFKNLENNKGVFFLNKSLTCTVNERNSHKEFWQAFTTSLIEYLDNSIDCKWLLWGVDAWNLGRNITKKHQIIKATHPAFWCYAEGEERLERKIDFATNSGMNVILN